MTLAVRPLWLFLCLAVGMVCLLLADHAQAQTLRPAGDKDQANITARAKYLRDPSGNITFRDIVRPAAQRSLKTLKQPFLKTGNDSQSTHWFKFEAIAPQKAPYQGVIYFTDRDISELTVFMQVVGANADVVRFGAGQPNNDVVERQYGVGLPIKIAAGEKRTIFVSVRGDNLSGRLELWQPRALRDYVQGNNQSGLGTLIFAGVALLLTLSLAGVLRAPFWVLLAAGVATYTAVFAASRGLYPLPQMSLSEDMQIFLLAIFAALILLFTGALSGLNKKLSAMGWFGAALASAIVASGAIAFVVPPQANIVVYLTIAFAVFLALAYCASLVALRPYAGWGVRALQCGLCAPLIALALPLPVEADVAGRLPFLAVIALAGLISGLEIVRMLRSDGEAVIEEEDDEVFETVTGVSDVLRQDSAAEEQVEEPAPEPETVVEPEPAQTSEPKLDDQKAVLESAAQRPASAAPAPEPARRASVPPLISVDQLPQNAFDTMTGVFNAATLAAVGDKLLYQVRRYKRPTAALMLRLDAYESLRESGGQTTADRAAKLLSVTCMRELRESDILGRFEEDVFVALLPETELEGARIALERACANLAERTLPTRVGMLRLKTLVASIAVGEQHEDFDALIAALYDGLAPANPSDGIDKQDSAATEAAE